MKKRIKAGQFRETRAGYRQNKVLIYPVIVHHSRYGYDAVCPVLPGCVSQGSTVEETLTNIKSAIQEYLDAVCKVKKGERLVMVEVPV